MLTRSMIGCAFEVIHEPGSGFLESAYEKAMMMGLSEARLSVQSHNPVKVRFREKPVGEKLLFILSIDVQDFPFSLTIPSRSAFGRSRLARNHPVYPVHRN